MKTWVDRLAAVECPAFTARRARHGESSGAAHDPLVWARAKEEFVWDADGRRFVDMTAGFGVMSLGHSPEPIRTAVEKQLGALWHALGDVHPSDKKIELMERLGALSPFEEPRVILGLSGSDAVDAALKTTQIVTGKPGVIAFEGAYHGLATGPLAVQGYKATMRAPFEATLNPHVVFLPFAQGENELTQLAATLDQLETTQLGAVIVEPIQGRGGVNIPAHGFLETLRAFCTERQLLLICDEVLTGFGRTGSLWASVGAGIRPDLLCVGKALGGGLPISACIGPHALMKHWGEPTSEALHTGTFFGNPLACAAALAFIDTMEALDLVGIANERGKKLRAVLERVGLARGKGMMWALELDKVGIGIQFSQALRARGFIVLPNGADATGIQLTPPLNLSEDALALFEKALTDAANEVLGNAVPTRSEDPTRIQDASAFDAATAAASTAAPSTMTPSTTTPSTATPSTATPSTSTARANLQRQILALIDELADGSTNPQKRDSLIDSVWRWQVQRVSPLATWNRVMGRAALPTEAFRFARIASFSEGEEAGRFLTSGTTAEARGQHAHRDLQLYDHAAKTAAKYAFFPDQDEMDLLVVGPHFDEAPTSSLFYMLTRFADWFASDCQWFVKNQALDVPALRARLKRAVAQNRPVALLGTSLAFMQLEGSLRETFRLPEGSRLMHTGGFKGSRIEVTQEALRSKLAARFGIAAAFVVREYGMTEMSSQLYEWSLRDALEGRSVRNDYWVPGWVRVQAHPPAALLGAGALDEQAILQFDDLANLDSCVSIQTLDIGAVTDESLSLMGRVEAAPLRGCSLTAESWSLYLSEQG